MRAGREALEWTRDTRKSWELGKSGRALQVEQPVLLTDGLQSPGQGARAGLHLFRALGAFLVALGTTWPPALPCPGVRGVSRSHREVKWWATVMEAQPLWPKR